MTDITATAPDHLSPEERRAAGRLRGVARMKEIAREDEAKRQHLVAELLTGLGRTPSAVDRITVETLAATAVRADRLRSAGRSDLEERRLIIQLQRGLGLKPQPAEPQKPDPQRAFLDHLSAGDRP